MRPLLNGGTLGGKRPAVDALAELGGFCGIPAIGEQLVDAISGMGADAEHHVAQVFDGIDGVGLAAGDEGIETRDVLAGVFVADEEEVLPAERDDS